jgi:hypothetical protein
MLAPEVELCSPRLLRLARCRASGDCGHSAGVLAAGPVTGSYSSLPPGAGFAMASVYAGVSECESRVAAARKRTCRLNSAALAGSEVVACRRAADHTTDEPAPAQPEGREHVRTAIASHVGGRCHPVTRCTLGESPDPHSDRNPTPFASSLSTEMGKRQGVRLVALGSTALSRQSRRETRRRGRYPARMTKNAIATYWQATATIVRAWKSSW